MDVTAKLTAFTRYMAECYGPDGRLKWQDEGHNLVVTEGASKVLDAAFVTGLASPAWYAGLKGSGAVATGDTLATHSGWAELALYSGNRPAIAFGAVSAGTTSNSGTKATFSIATGGTIYGAMSCNATSGTTGVLYGAGDFGTARTVGSGDTLLLTVTKTLAGS